MTKEVFDYARRLNERKVNISFVDAADSVLNDNQELSLKLSDNTIPLSVKYDLIEQNFPMQIRDYICELCKDGKVDLFHQIADTFRSVPLDHKEPFSVSLTYVNPPTEEQYERIRTFIFHKYKRRDTIFEEHQDESLIGGFRLRAGNQEYDWSLKGRLDQLSKTLDEYQRNNTADTKSILDQMKKEISEFELEAEDKQVGIIDLMRDNLMGENGIGQIRNDINGFELSAEDKEIGIVEHVGDGIATITGIHHAMYGEILLFDNGIKGMVQDIRKDNLGCILFSTSSEIGEGSRVIRTERMAGIPVGDGFLGRVIDALGSPIDGGGPIQSDDYRPIENDAPGIIDRKSVNVPLETGILSIDSMFPIGRGQRELIIGDRQTGKTSIAIDTILNQKGKDVICVYVAIGQKASTIAKIVNTLKTNDALSYTTVVVASASDSAPLQYIAPYSGTALAEYFMYAGKDVLIVYDDLSKHAVAYRALSLLLERSPGREAYPGDVFYLHSRLLERSSRLTPEKGGGSITALPIIETQAGDVSAYIPTNVISITDGQIFLESDLFHSGMRPAVNIGLSVSRVGGAAQTKSMKKAAGSLRISLAQYREMEIFTQFSSDLDASTRELLQYGRGLMELLKQPLCHPLSMHEQVITLVAATNKIMLDVPLNKMKEFQMGMLQFFRDHYPEIGKEIEIQKTLNDDLVSRVIAGAKEFKRQVFHM